ncbi:MAG: spermidine synthase [Pseudomonadota bacterium]
MSEAALPEVRGWRGMADRLGASPYVATVFLSAGLVFLVQPMFAKMATPLLGGSPNVWNVSLVCFQAALLLGYAYAHTLSHFVKSLRNQVAIHAVLLLLAAIVLPFQLSGALGEPNPNQPTLWLIGVFMLSIAPPFAVISATAPLIQRWYSFTGREDAHDPYHLYGASNIGSLLGLAAYPLLLEPLLPVAAQAQVWTVGYVVLAALLIVSGLVAVGTRREVLQAEGLSVTDQSMASSNERWKQRLWWITLAFIPSSLLVGVTTHIATDVASAPFLWAPPLMLYIATFIIVFAKRPPISLSGSLRYLPLAVAAAFLVLPSMTTFPLLLSFFLHLAALFLAALVCHGMLAEERPEPARLTEFYLLMSLGGVLGGAFNALLVPVIFNGVTEYPLMLVLLLLIRPEARLMGQGRTRLWSGVAMAAFVAAIILRLVEGSEEQSLYVYRILLALSVLGVIMARDCRLAPVICAVCAWGIGLTANPMTGAVSERGFFGVVKVLDRGNHRVMMHGTTLHGAQYLGGDDILRPTTYYAPEAPIGQVFAQHDVPGRIGVIGLGTGSVACYAREGQSYTYFEIDPLVAKFASDPAYFTYLSECTPEAETVLGDGRLTLAAEPEEAFNLLLIDAFSSDSVPAHLLTVEAVELYLSRPMRATTSASFICLFETCITRTPSSESRER